MVTGVSADDDDGNAAVAGGASAKGVVAAARQKQYKPPWAMVCSSGYGFYRVSGVRFFPHG